MIWLLSTPSPSLTSSNCLSFSVILCVAGRAYWRRQGGGGGKPNHTTARSLVLSIPFNTLYYSLWLLPWSGETHYDSVLSDSMEEEEASCQVFFYILLVFLICHRLFYNLFIRMVIGIYWFFSLLQYSLNFCVFYFLTSFSPNFTNAAIS